MAQDFQDMHSLAKTAGGTLSKQQHQLTVGELERRMLARFPKEQAESWDRTGLLAGDPTRPVAGVAVALDATLHALDVAQAAGANVLLTHHPAFLEVPGAFRAQPAGADVSGTVVYRAIERGIALINFHTAFDVSVEAQAVLPELLGLDQVGILERVGEGVLGYGQVCALREDERGMTLGQLAARCTSVFGRAPRVWGPLDQRLESIVCSNGAASSFTGACIEAGASCLVCGEVKYHSALDAMQAGLCIIDLGHDVSELPYVPVLARCVAECGIDPESITMIEQSSHWTTPEAIRV